MQCQHATAPQLTTVCIVWPLLLLFDTTFDKIMSDLLFEKKCIGMIIGQRQEQEEREEAECHEGAQNPQALSQHLCRRVW